jgi:formylglycine-generating enzyme required for sulfatase activity
MSGNVWEYCLDWGSAYSNAAQMDPAGPSTGALRVARGASWAHNNVQCRSAYRNATTSYNRSNNLGFRVVLANLSFAIPDATNPGATVSLVLNSIPGGTFTMGSPGTELDRQADEGPQHSVTLSPFYMGRFEVTQGQWKAVMGSNPSHFSIAGGGSTTDDLTRSVETVSYDDITAATTGFLAKLNAATTSTRPSGMVFRLPTEAEWEYAARAGTTSRFYWGDDPGYTDITWYAWFVGNSSSITHSVGTKTQNAFGLYDMSGNVMEWCQDWYGDYGTAAQTDPAGPSTGPYRVLRGGSWVNLGYLCRSACRSYIHDNDGDANIGFHVVLGSPRTP